MARDEYLQHLATVPLFSHCSDHQLREIGMIADELSVTPGTVLTRQGDVNLQLFVIIEGTASVTRDGRAAGTVGSGGFVGELALLARTPATATIIADTALDLLVLTSAGLSTLLDDIPGFAKHLLYEVAARFASIAPDHST